MALGTLPPLSLGYVSLIGMILFIPTSIWTACLLYTSYRNEAGEIFHTYSTYARGGDLLIGAHNFLDMTPKGRNEVGIMDWVRHHDRYPSKPLGAASFQPELAVSSRCD